MSMVCKVYAEGGWEGERPVLIVKSSSEQGGGVGLQTEWNCLFRASAFSLGSCINLPSSFSGDTPVVSVRLVFM